MSYLKHKPGSIEEMMANNAKKLNDIRSILTYICIRDIYTSLI